MKRLAVVPARGGSKRIPNKNIRDFCGAPMITHTLGNARISKLFDVVHVSTESGAVADVAAKFGYPVQFARPPALADDFTSIRQVLRYVVEEFQSRGQTFDQVWTLMACAPLLTSDDLIKAENLFVSSGSTSPVLAVCEFQSPVQWALRRLPDGHVSAAYPQSINAHSQDLEPHYFDAGSMGIFTADMAKDMSFAGTGYVGYILPKGTAVDIDDERDWKLAEAIYRTFNQREATQCSQ